MLDKKPFLLQYVSGRKYTGFDQVVGDTYNDTYSWALVYETTEKKAITYLHKLKNVPKSKIFSATFNI